MCVTFQVGFSQFGLAVVTVGGAEVLVDDRIVGGVLLRLGEPLDGFGEIFLHGINCAQVAECIHHPGVVFDRILITLFGFGQVSPFKVDDAHVAVHQWKVGFVFQRLLIVFEGFLFVALTVHGQAQLAVGIVVRRVNFNGLQKMLVGMVFG